MAVHSHVFRPYEGARTALRGRWLVVARYSLRMQFAEEDPAVWALGIPAPRRGG